MNDSVKLHTLTHSAMEDLQHAFLECKQKPLESRILSAIVSVKMVHDSLNSPEFSSSDIDPEELCCAV
jgi:hypothetical protein